MSPWLLLITLLVMQGCSNEANNINALEDDRTAIQLTLEGEGIRKQTASMSRSAVSTPSDFSIVGGQLYQECNGTKVDIQTTFEAPATLIAKSRKGCTEVRIDYVDIITPEGEEVHVKMGEFVPGSIRDSEGRSYALFPGETTIRVSEPNKNISLSTTITQSAKSRFALEFSVNQFCVDFDLSYDENYDILYLTGTGEYAGQPQYSASWNTEPTGVTETNGSNQDDLYVEYSNFQEADAGDYTLSFSFGNCEGSINLKIEEGQ